MAFSEMRGELEYFKKRAFDAEMILKYTQALFHTDDTIDKRIHNKIIEHDRIYSKEEIALGRLTNETRDRGNRR